jgi:hypothetical protein
LYRSNHRGSRRRTPKSLKKLAALATVAAAFAAPATAGGKILVETYNEGLEPHVVLEGPSPAISNPKQITVAFTANHEAELTAGFTIKCGHRRSRSYDDSGASPAVRTVRIGGKPGKCRVTAASARFADPLDEGWIQLRASAK